MERQKEDEALAMVRNLALNGRQPRGRLKKSVHQDSSGKLEIFELVHDRLVCHVLAGIEKKKLTG